MTVSPLPLQATDVTVAYDARPVLRSVSFSLEPGQMLGIVGPNGAGKSTLLKSLLGLIQPDFGQVRVFGEAVDDVRSRIAYVPQTEGVDWDFPITVREVVLMGRYGQKGWFGRPTKEDRERAHIALEKVGMAKFEKRHIRQLSGGQQRRVFLARALCQGAELLLLDEPFAGVDAATEKAIFALIDQMAVEGKALLVVNHDLSILDRFDRVLLLNQRVIAFGSPDVVVTEENLRATYGGRLSLLDEADETLRQRRVTGDPHLARTT
ncbi:metal ABC transporter ATP-binding protein [Algisphaera agarilytica]|uniref:Manganese/zinc/iron transport system ATP-binding protein n=1 Tax=Algisphaera agarilytica TaxID=1385975 RepID=A0A7X0H3T5_9BACT|nr:metal ABC transporter ATP-binding protein [Algisphaera agarilytica]MBB6428542.1 manganese/zinc/iron transport system ATP- binding protein [Algisphaera agarilytica]